MVGLGGIQLGVLAACVVLFVPMAMAGWHLSRNKTLFFGGALFITLAVCVHLTPHFPSVSDFANSFSSLVVFDHRDSCINYVNQIIWDVKPRHDVIKRNDSSFDCYEKNWDWVKSGKVNSCDFQRLGKSDASDLLNGSWIVVAGDSQARLVVVSFLRLILDNQRFDSIREDLFKRHSSYNIVVDEIGLALDFVWAPLETNLTDLIIKLKEKRKYPDVLVMGSGLWHMLHVNNASDYGVSLRLLKSSVRSLLPPSPEFQTIEPVSGSTSIRSPHMFWLGMPMLINGKLNTEEKKEKMNDKMWHAYDKALGESKLLRQTGGPLILLDMQSLTWNCGPRCTIDGMHYDAAIYEAVVHIMLNSLLIESHQWL